MSRTATSTITLTVPAEWVDDAALDHDALRQALKLGLDQLHCGRAAQGQTEHVAQALAGSGRIRRLATPPDDQGRGASARQPPPVLPGPPVSEILIAQRKSEP